MSEKDEEKFSELLTNALDSTITTKDFMNSLNSTITPSGSIRNFGTVGLGYPQYTYAYSTNGNIEDYYESDNYKLKNSCLNIFASLSEEELLGIFGSSFDKKAAGNNTLTNSRINVLEELLAIRHFSEDFLMQVVAYIKDIKCVFKQHHFQIISGEYQMLKLYLENNHKQELLNYF